MKKTGVTVTVELPHNVVKALCTAAKMHETPDRVTRALLVRMASYTAAYPVLAADPDTNQHQLKVAKQYFDTFYPEEDRFERQEIGEI